MGRGRRRLVSFYGTRGSRIRKGCKTTFTDAAFAFALTLHVIWLDPPSTFSQLGTALRGVPAFLLSASMLMMFWWGHHQ